VRSPYPLASVEDWRSRKFASSEVLRLFRTSMQEQKTQNSLNCSSTLCWTVAAERCAWSGEQAKRLAVRVLSKVQLRAGGHIPLQMQKNLALRLRALLIGEASKVELALA
jgi:hypothetical protein